MQGWLRWKIKYHARWLGKIFAFCTGIWIFAVIFLDGEKVENPKNNDIEPLKSIEVVIPTKLKVISTEPILPVVTETEVETIMRSRTEVMKRACKMHGLDIQGTNDGKWKESLLQMNPWEYFINWDHSLIWCNVFKSASSSWMFIFNILAGYKPSFLEKTRKVPLTLARDKYPRPSQQGSRN